MIFVFFKKLLTDSKATEINFFPGVVKSFLMATFNQKNIQIESLLPPPLLLKKNSGFSDMLRFLGIWGKRVWISQYFLWTPTDASVWGLWTSGTNHGGKTLVGSTR